MDFAPAQVKYVQDQQRAMEKWVRDRQDVVEYVVLSPHDRAGTASQAYPRRVPRIEQ